MGKLTTLPTLFSWILGANFKGKEGKVGRENEERKRQWKERGSSPQFTFLATPLIRHSIEQRVIGVSI